MIAIVLAVAQKLSWYIARSSGMIAWAMVTASILWGVALSSRLVRRRGIPAWLLDLHRYLGTLSIVFTIVHLLGLAGDNYVHFGWSELFVPMSSSWQPGNVAWGIAAFYVLVAVQLTSWTMRRMPRRVWHTIHLTSILMFVVATVHGLRSGTDRGNRLLQWMALTGCTLVVMLLLFRLATLGSRSHRARPGSSAPARTLISVETEADTVVR